MQRIFRMVRNERGGGLLMALLVIVALAAIAAGIIASISTDRRLSSYNMTRAKALNYAEAGVAEALERIRTGDVPDNGNPLMVSQIYLTSAGDVPAVGADTTAMGTAQPSGQWLPYSSEVKGPEVLTVRYLTNAARTGIYKYDATKSPPVQGVSGSPIFVITSPARVGTSRRQIETQVSKITINPNIKAAYTADDHVKFDGPITAVGYDYVVDTPAYTCNNGNRNTTWESGTNNKPAVWATDKVEIKGASKVYGANPSATQQYQTGFYSGPWDVIGMQQQQFFGWIGQPLLTPKNGAFVPRGLTYLGDPKDKPQKGKRDFKLKSGNGDGLLYVNGNLEISGDFTFRGLIYVEGTLRIKGTGWVLGAVVVKDNGKYHASHKQTCQILKSDEAVRQFISKYGAQFTTIAWRES